MFCALFLAKGRKCWICADFLLKNWSFRGYFLYFLIFIKEMYAHSVLICRDFCDFYQILYEKKSRRNDGSAQLCQLRVVTQPQRGQVVPPVAHTVPQRAQVRRPLHMVAVEAPATVPLLVLLLVGQVTLASVMQPSVCGNSGREKNSSLRAHYRSCINEFGVRGYTRTQR